MPYHAEALGQNWGQVDKKLQAALIASCDQSVALPFLSVGLLTGQPKGIILTKWE
jgi:hypothetical protein